jgi:tetratricopeptide (TPR) repeat protein
MLSRYCPKTNRRFLGILFLGSLTLCLWLGQLPSTLRQAELGSRATAQAETPSQLVQQGVERYQAGDYQNAIAHWQEALKTYTDTNNLADKAIVLENLARAYQQIGHFEQAIQDWEQVIAYYRQLGDLQQVGRMLTEQAQAYNSLGQHRQAIALLCGMAEGTSAENAPAASTCRPGSALQIARQHNDSLGEVAALGSLGEAYRLAGNYEPAIDYLKQAQAINHPDYQASILNSLGNAYVSRAQLWTRRANSALIRGATPRARQFKDKATEDYQQALLNYRHSLQLAQTQGDRAGQVRVLLNWLRLHNQQPALTLGDVQRQEALALWQSLPDSSAKVYGAIDLGNFLAATDDRASPLSECPPQPTGSQTEALGLFNQAVKIAQTLQDNRAESFALGTLAHFYECHQDYAKALELTQKALWIADQNLAANDSLYLWEWQAGRILQVQGKTPEAITAYERAYSTLEKIRSDILIANRDVQFDFRDVIEPLYRQLAKLKLEFASLSSLDIERQKQELTGAIRTINSLKLAELQNYFGNDCLLNAIDEPIAQEQTLPESDRKISTQLQRVGSDTAVLIPIILEDRTAIVASLPSGKTRNNRMHWLEIKRETFRKEIDDFRTQLSYPTQAYLQPAQRLYDRLIRPFAADLEAGHVKTLIFIQDGFLRSIPMAALHDGKEFLIEKYAIATTPSLSLTASQAPLPKTLRVLAVGLTQAATVDGETYPALPNVSQEIERVQGQFSGSKQLLTQVASYLGLREKAVQ